MTDSLHPFGSTTLLLMGLGAIALLLLLILRIKLHPFVALLLVSVLVAVIAGISSSDVAATIEGGMGKTLGHIALIIPLGAMIGRMIERSGGADALAASLVARFGERRAHLALTASAVLIGIPVFFEVGVIMLMPIAYGVARTTRQPLLKFALPMCITLLIVHALLPPHPGPVAVASLLGADVGRILLWGLPIAVLTTLGAVVIARTMTALTYDMSEDIRTEIDRAETPTSALRPTPPGVPLVVALILVPIVLIILGTLAGTSLPKESTLRHVLTVLGIPFLALLLDVLLCAGVLSRRAGWSQRDVADVMGSAIPGIAVVILITGAGGIFASVLVASGIGNAISELLRATGIPVLGLAFVLTLLLRAAQGPTTVALITTAGIISPLVARSGFGPNQLALVCIAMGAGGLAVSHVNDAGFWIVTRLTGLSVGDGLKTWTVISTCAGVLAFLLTALLWSHV